MALTDQLGAPVESGHKMGRFSLNRIVRCEAAVATPVVWTNLSNVVAIEISDPSWDYEADVFQQGGGDEKTHIQRGPRWDGTITVIGGKVGDMLATLFGETWTTAGNTAMSLRSDDDSPMIIWEAICRDSNNSTHLFSLVIQDMIMDSLGMANPMDYADISIPFHTYHEPFLLCTGAEMVYDRWDATPGTATYSTSCGTPLELVTAASHDDWHYDNMVFCKNMDNSDSETIGHRVTSGVALSGGTLTFTTGTPAASDEVSVLYAKAT